MGRISISLILVQEAVILVLDWRDCQEINSNNRSHHILSAALEVAISQSSLFLKEVLYPKTSRNRIWTLTLWMKGLK